MFSGIGSTELLIVLAIVVLLFGGKKLPEIGSGIGKAIRNFKQSTKGQEEKQIDDNANNDQEKPSDK